MNLFLIMLIWIAITAWTLAGAAIYVNSNRYHLSWIEKAGLFVLSGPLIWLVGTVCFGFSFFRDIKNRY